MRSRLSCPNMTLIGMIGLVIVSSIGAAEPRAIVVEPTSIVLDGAASRQQVVVSLCQADGGTLDVTARARWEISTPIVRISESGVLTPENDGEARLRVRVDEHAVDVPVRVVNAHLEHDPSYRLEVAAVLVKSGCNSGPCHGNLSGKGGFRLSLRGTDPTADFLALTHDTFGRRLDRLAAESSLIYRKPTGMVAHEGGLRFGPGTPEARLLLSWIRAGARDDRESAPQLRRLIVWPKERLIVAPGRSQQLVVMAEFSDGSRRDVTRLAAFDVNDPSFAEVTPEGRVQVGRPGEVTVAVRYLEGRGVSTLAFLPDRPEFVWRGPAPASRIDAAVFAKLKALKINPSEPCTDSVFVRRVYLDTIGVLPSPDEVRTFLADSHPDRRAHLIDRLIDRPEFADYWALKWADLLRNEEKTMGPKGVWVFQRWLRDQVAVDVPVDEFTRSLIGSVGSTWRNPPASFYRTNRDPESAAEAVGQVFLGVRLQCARCHNHPFDVWTQDDYYGLAAFFSNLGHKIINNERRDRFDNHEINGDEVIYLTGKPQMVQPRSGEMMQPKPPGAPGPDLGDDRFALDDLADWLTRDNPQFARNIANRVWFHVLGRGVVDPVDDFRDSNPPSNPALLDVLTEEFRRGGMRLKPLVREILRSQTYQLSSSPNETNAEDETHFARYPVKLLPAEVLLDAIGAALGAHGRLEESGRSRQALPGVPEEARAVQLPGVRLGGEFLKVFGKPERLLTCECERSDGTTLAQAFQLVNGDAVRDRLEQPENRIGKLLQSGLSDEEILSELYLAALAREPNASEQSGALQHVRRSSDRRRAWEDVAWAIINSKEFLLRH